MQTGGASLFAGICGEREPFAPAVPLDSELFRPGAESLRLCILDRGKITPEKQCYSG